MRYINTKQTSDLLGLSETELLFWIKHQYLIFENMTMIVTPPKTVQPLGKTRRFLLTEILKIHEQVQDLLRHAEHSPKHKLIF